MKECPHCGNSFSDAFLYCPADGSPLGGNGEETIDSSEDSRTDRQAAQIKIRTLMLGFATLVLAAAVAFTAVFFYQYWKPKYGSLIIKTTPAGATIYVDGRLRGVSPIALSDLRSGSYQLKGTKEGFKDFVQQVTVMPYTAENLHWNLEAIVPHLTNEQLAEIEAWRKKLESAQRENILLPPPDDYNVLYFADKILSVDPANAYAAEVKEKLAETMRQLAEFAYARQDWLESEKQYKNLALLFPNDPTIEERLGDIAAKIDASVKGRETQIQDLKTKAEAAIKSGNLLPPDKDNALDAVRSIQRLDKDSIYVRETIAHIKELLQNRGDTKIAASDWSGARNDFRIILQYFPEDNYSKNRLSTIDVKLAEAAQAEQQLIQHATEEQQTRQKIIGLRQSALNAYRGGSFEKSISDWQEYLKFEPNSDEAFYYLGASNQERKQYDTAILNFEKCLSINPNYVLAHVSLGMLYDYHRNNFKIAEEHFKKAKDLGGTEKYNPDRLQAMIQDLHDRTQANSILNTLFQAEHKHAFSSCRGYLIFKEEGLEYQTAETDHSFYETYKELRSFVLQGTDLSIKTRNNKKYNLHFLNARDAARVRAWNVSSRTVQLSGQAE
jgi:tetratricopeptide (TPR) repeat protein